MSSLENDFETLFRRNDLVAAKAALDRWVAADNPSVALSEFWRACLLDKMGNRDAAIAILSDVVASGIPRYQLCLLERASIYFESKRFRAAATDYQSILDDKSPMMVDGFHLSARFCKAWCLAALGDPDFEQEAAKVAPGYSEWRNGGFKTIAEIRKIYDEARGNVG